MTPQTSSTVNHQPNNINHSPQHSHTNTPSRVSQISQQPQPQQPQQAQMNQVHSVSLARQSSQVQFRHTPQIMQPQQASRFSQGHHINYPSPNHRQY